MKKVFLIIVAIFLLSPLLSFGAEEPKEVFQKLMRNELELLESGRQGYAPCGLTDAEADEAVKFVQELFKEHGIELSSTQAAIALGAEIMRQAVGISIKRSVQKANQNLNKK